MRHRNTKKILNRPADQRKALVRSLLTSLFLHGHVKTTSPKANVLSAKANQLLSKIRSKDSMNAIRDLKKVVYTEQASKNALAYVIQKAPESQSFTRLTKISVRAGDNAELIQVDLI